MSFDSSASVEQFRKVNDVAAQLGVSPQHVRNLITEGKLQPACRFGNVFRIPQKTVDLFVRRAVVQPMSRAA